MINTKKQFDKQKKSVVELQEQAQEQANEYLAGWKRCKADFENYKKQQEELTQNFRVYANEALLQDIIPVIDNFELALNHIPETSENKSWQQGVLHIKKQLDEVLVNNNVRKIEVKTGDQFDPYFHECVKDNNNDIPESSESGKSDNTLVVEKIIRNGYKLGEKLLRPAQVTLKSFTGN